MVAADDGPWYVPDQAKLQLAGGIGFLSPGVGWATGAHRLEIDLFFGWVPRAIGGEDVHALTGKLTVQPWRLPVRGRVFLRPFTAALQLTYTFGRRFWVRSPERYPSGYWGFPSALRASLALGASASVRTGGALDEIGVYCEAVALDVMLVAWARNRRALGIEDVFTVAVGLRAAF